MTLNEYLLIRFNRSNHPKYRIMDNVLTPEDVASRIECEFMQSDSEFAEQWRKEVMDILESINQNFAKEVHLLVLEGEAYQTYLSESEILNNTNKL